MLIRVRSAPPIPRTGLVLYSQKTHPRLPSEFQVDFTLPDRLEPFIPPQDKILCPQPERDQLLKWLNSLRKVPVIFKAFDREKYNWRGRNPEAKLTTVTKYNTKKPKLQKAASQGKIDEFQNILGSRWNNLIDSPEKSDTKFYNALIHGFSLGGDLVSARKWFDTYHPHTFNGFNPLPLATYNAMLRCCHRKGNSLEAFALMDDLKMRQHVVPSSSTFEYLIGALLNDKSVGPQTKATRLQEIIKEMESMGIKVNGSIHCLMIQIVPPPLQSFRNEHSTNIVFNQQFESNPVSVLDLLGSRQDLTRSNYLALLRIASIQSDQNAFNVIWRELATRGGLSRMAYHYYLRLLEKQEDKAEALPLFKTIATNLLEKEAVQKGFCNRRLIHTFLKTSTFCGDMTSFTLLTNLILPNRNTFRILVRACAKNRLFERCEMFQEEMTTRGWELTQQDRDFIEDTRAE